MQFLSKSLQQHLSCYLNAVKNLLRYLKGTKVLVINYGVLLTGLISDIIKDIPYDPLLPLGFSNNDFASHKVTSKSTYGYLFTVAGGPVNWKSKRSNTIALSTIEAKSNALTEVIRKTQWLKNLYLELNKPIKSPTLVLKDD